MSMPGMEKRKPFMTLLGLIFVLATASLASSAGENQMVSREKSSSEESEILANALMQGHMAEAAQAAKEKKDLKAAAKHTQMAIDAYEGGGKEVYLKTKLDPKDMKQFNEGIQSLKEALKKAESGDSKGFEKALEIALEKLNTKCHGVGCRTLGCGCALTQSTGPCDPAHPAKKCTTVGCNCYCL